MRIRRVDQYGDMLFGGSGQLDLWHDVPEAVALFVLYRLRLNLGEWFADLSQGMPWATEVLGERTQATRDIAVRAQVRQTPGVKEVVSYGSRINTNTRTWDCQLTIDTIYGQASIILTRLPGEVPPMQKGYLGIVGGPGTRIQMVPANLEASAHANISDFQIVSTDAGRY